jgi:hypothetical protein
VVEAVINRADFQVVGNLQELYQMMDVARPPQGSPGSMEAFAQLRSRRLVSPVICLNVKVTQDPNTTSTTESPSASLFLPNVNMPKTQMRTLVRVVRLLWPEAQDDVREFITDNIGSDMGDTFDTIWGLSTPPALSAFVKALRHHLKSLILWHPFVKDSIRTLMGNSVFCFDKFGDKLRFKLDDGCMPSKKTEYVLNFHNGNITGSNGIGFVCSLFGMQKFFLKNGDVTLMAKMLVEVGIGRALRYDDSVSTWR